MNHLDIEEGKVDMPNLYTIYILRKMDQKGDGAKISKKLSTWFMVDSIQPSTSINVKFWTVSFLL